jgi:hypothetical protein
VRRCSNNVEMAAVKKYVAIIHMLLFLLTEIVVYYNFL